MRFPRLLAFDATECVPGLSVYSCRQTLSIAIENVGGGYRQRPTSGLGFRRLAVAQPQINVLELLRDGDRRCDSATRSYARDRAISENMVRRTGHETAPDLQPESDEHAPRCSISGSLRQAPSIREHKRVRVGAWITRGRRRWSPAA